MKLCYRLFRRNNGIWFWEDCQTGQQGSLRTRDEKEANRLLNAKNAAAENPAVGNIHIAKTYLAMADPMLSKRTWRQTVECGAETCDRLGLLFRFESVVFKAFSLVWAPTALCYGVQTEVDNIREGFDSLRPF